MYEFRLSGEVSSYDYYDSISLDLVNAHLDVANGDNLLIDINSIGGCVTTGMSIYAAIRRYAKKHNATVTTRSAGFVASSGTFIFLSGDKDKRIVNEFLQPFVHEPRYDFSYSQTSKEFQKDAKDLESVTNIMADFYSKNTNMSVEEALELMANDTWMTAQQCIDTGFASEIEELTGANSILIASISNKFNQKTKTMSKKTSGILRALGFLAKKTVAQIELADLSGKPVVFPDLEEGGVPSEGDNVVYDGESEFTGAIETDNYILDVEGGVISNVIDKSEVDETELIEELVELIEEKDLEIEQLQAKLKAYKNVKGKVEQKETSKQNRKEGSESDSVKASAAKLLERMRKSKKK